MKIKKLNNSKWLIDFTLQHKRIRRVIYGNRQMAEQAVLQAKNKVYNQQYGVAEKKPQIKFTEYTEFYREHYTKEK